MLPTLQSSKSAILFTRITAQPGMPMVHRFVRGPQVAPSLAAAGRGRTMAQAVEDKAAPWFKLWKVDSKPDLIDASSVLGTLPPDIQWPRPSEFRATARTFAWRTAMGACDSHPRWLAHLSDARLAQFLQIFKVALTYGTIPKQLLLLTMFLLPKPAGGERTIHRGFPTFEDFWTQNHVSSFVWLYSRPFWPLRCTCKKK